MALHVGCTCIVHAQYVHGSVVEVVERALEALALSPALDNLGVYAATQGISVEPER